MFSTQANHIANALKSAGIPPDAAIRIAAILGNGFQQVTRTNPETVDLTPQQMRFVTPDVRRHQLQGLDFRQGDPYYQPYQLEATEERRLPRPADTVRSEPSPQATNATYRMNGGKFTEAKGVGGSVQMDLRFQGQGRLPLLDHQSNTIVGKNMRAESDDSGLRFQIEETGTELVWKLQLSEYLDKLPAISVITGLSFEGTNLRLKVTTIKVVSWQEMPDMTVPIPVTECETGA